jgi:hypothetical protein
MTKGLSGGGFAYDLKVGQDAEERVKKILGGAKATIEVKSDKQAARTRNVYVEYESRGKPSGISTSTADWWWYEIEPDVFVVMRRERMAELVRRRLAKYGPVLGGDYNLSKGVLLRVSELVTPLKEEEL